MKLVKMIVGLLVAVIVGVICWFAFKADLPTDVTADLIYEATEETGRIGEKVIGDPDEAEIILYEYADFGCSHCAEWNRTINKLMEKYGEKIALVFRSYNLGFKNGAAAARAATAAQIQGYFREYKDLLFENQAEWLYEEKEKLDELFVRYFEEASSGAGNVDKFKKDMESESVKARLEYEQSMGKKIGLVGTPTFRIGGENIKLNELEKVIEQKIGD